MKVALPFVIVFFLSLSTCSQNGVGLAIERIKTNSPVKLLIGGSNEDSTRIRILVPQELRLTNNFPHKVQLTQAYISLSGANIMSRHTLYQMSDSLFRLQGKTYASDDKASYLLYAGYLTTVPNSEVDSLKSRGRFAQLLRKREVYDLGELEESLHYLNRKIPDSVRGFMNLDCYNFETRLRFVESVPVEF